MDVNKIKQLIAKDKLVKFYQCPAWRKLRGQVLERDNHECQRCKAEGKVKTPLPTHGISHHTQHLENDERNKIKSLHVHHKKEVKDFPELALVMSNLITLCQECHNKEHDRLKEYKKKRERFTNVERW